TRASSRSCRAPSTSAALFSCCATARPSSPREDEWPSRPATWCATSSRRSSPATRWSPRSPCGSCARSRSRCSRRPLASTACTSTSSTRASRSRRRARSASPRSPPASRPSCACRPGVPRVLDGGALGVIAPHIGTPAEAREVVAAAKFPPFGERSMAGPPPHLQYRAFPPAEANAAMNEATMVVVQFETADALERADEIAEVEGVDLVLMGTNDLLADMGLAGQYEHPRVREAY